MLETVSPDKPQLVWVVLIALLLGVAMFATAITQLVRIGIARRSSNQQELRWALRLGYLTMLFGVLGFMQLFDAHTPRWISIGFFSLAAGYLASSFKRFRYAKAAGQVEAR